MTADPTWRSPLPPPSLNLTTIFASLQTRAITARAIGAEDSNSLLESAVLRFLLSSSFVFLVLFFFFLGSTTNSSRPDLTNPLRPPSLNLKLILSRRADRSFIHLLAHTLLGLKLRTFFLCFPGNQKLGLFQWAITPGGGEFCSL